MKIVTTQAELQAELTHLGANKSIGFVPTMGALHKGHLALVTASVAETDYTVASIFVNPTQFNNPNDLASYPRMVDYDLDMLKKANCHLVFMPNVQEMYPEPDNRVFDLGILDRIMEGEHRPGHFNGVAQIVFKLFDAVKPNKAFFGRKDFQQVAVIHKLANSYMSHLGIEVIACPTIREKDGLALSSRNLLLTPEHRKAAPLIFRTLNKAHNIMGKETVKTVKQYVKDRINTNKLFELEYFDIVSDNDYTSVKDGEPFKNITGCIAVQAGNVRLIDNISFDIPNG